VSAWRERWPAPVTWWLVGLAVAGGIAAEIHGGAGGWRSWVPYLVLPGAALGALVAMSRQQVVIDDGVLHVPGARAPLTALGAPEVLDREQLRLWRGPRAHRDAWVTVRPWQRGAVRLPVVDPEDDTPYWLVGSKRPKQLAQAVEERR
jgi:hypothetical protein